MPVFTARLSAVVGSYLGQTGSNLRRLFAFAETNPAVVLLDELDALGRLRGRLQDVGEIDRVVISLLQELDHSRPAGVLVAATNLKEAIDPALWRRFDLVLRFPLPSRATLQRFVRRRIDRAGERGCSERALRGARTFADVERAAEQVRRERVLAALKRSERGDEGT